ncbi:hypothetical protein G3I60_11305 [Streptomyces sp. SID13666]|uniref:hypothetical protein n=1 Tax=Streptomyces TaxID=1883 RepID=UPI0011073101|nr:MULTISPECIES: hypothetical protein [Streptomyces]MCZ4101540.1 hypothetical protein [Streptomyces sp. H39-C1]NEA54718.1 hypothetical protein [Streptomyces sp. SID13666]NEA70507.1 hypothetical protein [Streptomyces sp. SID13588]QNA77311.1 hypothetical protein C8250_040725 [Streptomyces sp. So13.3]
MEWNFEDRNGTGVLHLYGHLGRRVTDRFAGAVGWARARTTGTLVLDVSGLMGWSPDGEAAILAAAPAGLALCGLRGRPTPLLTENALVGVRVFPDLDVALTALAQAPEPAETGRRRQAGPSRAA